MILREDSSRSLGRARGQLFRLRFTFNDVDGKRGW